MQYEKIYMLTPIRKLENEPEKGLYNLWQFKCDCGNEVKNRMSLVLYGNSQSCGCLQRKRCKEAITTHGLSRHHKHKRFYSIFNGIKQRCNNPKKDCYINYGGRGIKISDEWSLFEGFYSDMYESYVSHVEKFGEMNTTIDRIDVDRNYCKENCKWSTRREQSLNRRINKK